MSLAVGAAPPTSVHLLLAVTPSVMAAAPSARVSRAEQRAEVRRGDSALFSTVRHHTFVLGGQRVSLADSRQLVRVQLALVVVQKSRDGLPQERVGAREVLQVRVRRFAVALNVPQRQKSLKRLERTPLLFLLHDGRFVLRFSCFFI